MGDIQLLIDSRTAAPDAYPTLAEKAAALLHSLARDHALVDGNKRLAWVAMRLFCAMNGRDVRAPSADDGESLVLDVASGQMDLPEITKVLATWMGPAADG